MPHLLLELSANVPDRPDLRRVLVELHEAIAATGHVERRDVKSRAVVHSLMAVAEGDDDRAFVALTLSVLEGHSDEAKGRMADAALAVLAQAFPLLAEGGRGGVSVEVRDMHRASYRRIRPSAA